LEVRKPQGVATPANIRWAALMLQRGFGAFSL
jgi:hypothetical protein